MTDSSKEDRQCYETADCSVYDLLKQYVREMRSQRPTEAESILWNYLRSNNLGTHFRRQHIIGRYIADFCCLKSKLVIELDGGYHQLPTQHDSDEQRTKWLKTQGFKVIRFHNEEVIGNLDNVLDKIKSNL